MRQLRTSRGRRILWLEILVNDQLDPYVAHRFKLTPQMIRTAAAAAVAASPQDTALFVFSKTVDLFCQSLSSETSS